MVHDLENIKFWITNKSTTIASVSVKTSISHRIAMGGVITNKPQYSDAFFGCWKTSIGDAIALDKVYKRLILNFSLKFYAAKTM